MHPKFKELSATKGAWATPQCTVGAYREVRVVDQPVLLGPVENPVGEAELFFWAIHVDNSPKGGSADYWILYLDTKKAGPGCRSGPRSEPEPTIPRCAQRGSRRASPAAGRTSPTVMPRRFLTGGVSHRANLRATRVVARKERRDDRGHRRLGGAGGAVVDLEGDAEAGLGKRGAVDAFGAALDEEAAGEERHDVGAEAARCRQP